MLGVYNRSLICDNDKLQINILSYRIMTYVQSSKTQTSLYTIIYKIIIV